MKSDFPLRHLLLFLLIDVLWVFVAAVLWLQTETGEHMWHFFFIVLGLLGASRLHTNLGHLLGIEETK